jgi:hypothetical protein
MHRFVARAPAKLTGKNSRLPFNPWGASVTKRLDQQGEGGHELPAARIIEVVARKWRTPIRENSDEPSVGEIRLH